MESLMMPRFDPTQSPACLLSNISCAWYRVFASCQLLNALLELLFITHPLHTVHCLNPKMAVADGWSITENEVDACTLLDINLLLVEMFYAVYRFLQLPESQPIFENYFPNWVHYKQWVRCKTPQQMGITAK